MYYSPSGSSAHGILQTRILEWVAICFSRGSFWPRDRTYISCVSWIDRWILLLLSHQGRPPKWNRRRLKKKSENTSVFILGWPNRSFRFSVRWYENLNELYGLPSTAIWLFGSCHLKTSCEPEWAHHTGGQSIVLGTYTPKGKVLSARFAVASTRAAEPRQLRCLSAMMASKMGWKEGSGLEGWVRSAERMEVDLGGQERKSARGIWPRERQGSPWHEYGREGPGSHSGGGYFSVNTL